MSDKLAIQKERLSMSEALKALLNYEQADEEGVMVLASREAIHVVSGELDTALTRIREMEQVIDLTEKSVLAEYYSGRLNGDARIKEGFKNLRAALSSKDRRRPMGDEPLYDPRQAQGYPSKDEC